MTPRALELSRQLSVELARNSAAPIVLHPGALPTWDEIYDVQFDLIVMLWVVANGGKRQ